MDYKLKYLKYKNKYLHLKNQIGQGRQIDNIKTNSMIKTLLTNLLRVSTDKYSVRAVPGITVNIKKLYNDDLLLDEINKLETKDVINRNEDNFKILTQIFDNLFSLNYNVDSLDLGPGMKLLLEELGVYIKKSCTVREFMTRDEPNLTCNNPTLVQGSCSEPPFFSELNNISPDNDKIIELLELVETKLEVGKSLGIVVGADKSGEFTGEGDLTLFFSPIATSESIDSIIEQMRSSPFKSKYQIHAYFPTNQMDDNKRVLDLILRLTDKFNIKFLNKMCGSCFRSMWYLVNNSTRNFTYEVNPKQGLGNADSADIRRCFKA
jgi:hypothetical protein